MKVKASATRKVGSAMKVSISRATTARAGERHEGQDQREDEAKHEAAGARRRRRSRSCAAARSGTARRSSTRRSGQERGRSVAGERLADDQRQRIEEQARRASSERRRRSSATECAGRRSGRAAPRSARMGRPQRHPGSGSHRRCAKYGVDRRAGCGRLAQRRARPADRVAGDLQRQCYARSPCHATSPHTALRPRCRRCRPSARRAHADGRRAARYRGGRPCGCAARTGACRRSARAAAPPGSRSRS